MQGVVARRNNFAEPILDFLEAAYKDFGDLTGRYYGLISQYKTRRCRHRLRLPGLRGREHRSRGRLPPPDPQRQRRLHPRQRHPPLPRGGHRRSPARQEERHHPRAHRRSPLRRQPAGPRHPHRAVQGRAAQQPGLPAIGRSTQVPHIYGGSYGLGSRDFRPEHVIGALRIRHRRPRPQGRQDRRRRRQLHRPRHRPPLRRDRRRNAFAAA